MLDRRSRDEFLADVRHRLGDLKGLTVEVGQPISHRIDAMLSGTKANIAIKLFGEDLNRMYALATQIGRSIAGVEDVYKRQPTTRRTACRMRRWPDRPAGVSGGATSSDAR